MSDDNNYQLFINWRAEPIRSEPGYPQTLDDFCKKHSVSRKQISEYMRSPTFQEDLVSATMRWAKERTPELIHQIYFEVKKTKSVADLEKFVNIVHELKKKEPSYQQNNYFLGIDDNKFKRIAMRAIEYDSINKIGTNGI